MSGFFGAEPVNISIDEIMADVREMKTELAAKEARMAELEAENAKAAELLQKWTDLSKRSEDTYQARISLLEDLLREAREYVVGFVEVHLPRGKGIVVDDNVKAFVSRIDSALSDKGEGK